MPKILAIDDKPDNLIAISALLKALIPDCSVITASSGPEGIEMATTDAPDVILLDIRMPGMDGFETCQNLRNNEITSHIPVIMISAVETESADLVKGLESGADAYLTKPINEYVLAAQVKTALRMKAAEDRLRGHKEMLEEMVQDKVQELQKSEEKFSRFFFSSPTWLAFTRLSDGTFLEINETFEKITGFSRHETVGRTVLEIGLWGDIAKRDQLMNMAREKGGFKEQEVTFYTKDKRPIQALWSAVVVEMDGEDCLLSTVMDISELKQAQKDKESLQNELQQAHKMEAIGNLAGGIAHEFNNVLSIILGNAELALDDVSDGHPAEASLNEIRKASFRAKEVVGQILSFARKTMTALKPLEINRSVEESIKLIRASIPAMIGIQQNISSKPQMILGDSTEIHQIVINLCNNSAHAMKETGGILEVGVSEVTLDKLSVAPYEGLSPGDFVKLTVKDTGEGISPDILEKVFEPYFTTKEFGAGSGMGLSVVYGLVKKCKGAISIRSTMGAGTTVEVLFPKIKEKKLPQKEKKAELPRGKERILMVDDDPAIVGLICQILKKLGYTVTGMTDSIAALDSFRANPEHIDLVITDMSMPNMSGDQLAAELIKLRKDIPVLLCTGHSDNIDEIKAKEIGIKEFAMKPLDMSNLAKVVRGVLDKRHDG